MNQQISLIKTAELLSRFKVQVGILNASSMLDINIVAEDFFIPVLNEVYACNLVNANSISKSYPAVDLIDKVNRISFQITSTSTPTKVKSTLEKIVKNEFYNDYDTFYILIITKREPKYKEAMIRTATQNKFSFDDNNILDVESLFQKITTLPLDKIQKIETYLKSQYTDIEITNQLIINKIPNLIGDQNYKNEYLKSQLNNAYKARQEWFDKKSYLEVNLASIYDINQKFSIDKSIRECNDKILEYENTIFNLLND